MKKLIIFGIIVCVLMSSAYAITAIPSIYNPFTNQLDYIWDGNLSSAGINTSTFGGDSALLNATTAPYLFTVAGGNVTFNETHANGTFVRQLGDTMTGPLVIQDTRVNLTNGSDTFIETIGSLFTRGIFIKSSTTGTGANPMLHVDAGTFATNSGFLNFSAGQSFIFVDPTTGRSMILEDSANAWRLTTTHSLFQFTKLFEISDGTVGTGLNITTGGNLVTRGTVHLRVANTNAFAVRNTTGQAMLNVDTINQIINIDSKVNITQNVNSIYSKCALCLLVNWLFPLSVNSGTSSPSREDLSPHTVFAAP